MAESVKKNRSPTTLAERFDRYCAEVQLTNQNVAPGKPDTARWSGCPGI